MIYLYKIISILTFVLPQTPFFLTSQASNPGVVVLQYAFGLSQVADS